MTPDPSPALPADAAEGSIHMQIVIDFHSARQSGKNPEESEMDRIGTNMIPANVRKRGVHVVSLHCPSGFRSARAEAHGQDPAEAESRGPDHLHPGSGQTQRRQVHDQVRQQQTYMEIRGADGIALRYSDVSCCTMKLSRSAAVDAGILFSLC